ncbi:MAG: carboxymuconolactone decarboxylase family protein [Bryobacteraceae bacterium]|nr:carboxymuconolactone decarboxylase family protein [Bryobacteraceae bacterium]
MTSTQLLSAQTIATAPEGSRETLTNIQKGFGFIPNLMATFANSPAVLNGYLALDSFFQKTSFKPAERELILLAASVENECGYCTAAHSMIAKNMLKVPADLVAAIRAGHLEGDDRLTVLAATVRLIVRHRGNLPQADVDRFLAAGFTPDQLIEVLLGIALKTISNYTDHLFHPTLDAAFASEK